MQNWKRGCLFSNKKKGDLRIQTNFFCKGRWGKVIEFANLKIQDRKLNCLKSCDSVC